MTTSSTQAAVSDAPTMRGTGPLLYRCPDWCTDDTEAHRDGDDIRVSTDVIGGDLRVHSDQGTWFGPFQAGASFDLLTGEAFGVFVEADEVAVRRLLLKGEPGLHEISERALEAADWFRRTA